MKNFKELNISTDTLRAIEELEYKNLTPIQALAIPLLLEKKHIIAKAETGSGKTAAYAIPMIEHINWLENKPQGLIIVPNRELTIQITEDIRHLGRYKRIKAYPIFGRASIKEQTLALKQKNHIIVATPGRLMDLIERGSISLEKLQYLIIDEADELLRKEFLKQLKNIFENLPNSCNTSLFSATISDSVKEVSHFRDTKFEYIDATKEGSLQIQEKSYFLEEGKKFQALTSILHLQSHQGGIIFTGTKNTAEKVCKHLNKENIHSVFIHSDLDQKQRIQNMNNFKKGNYLFLVATDLSARGIDVDGIDLVINYDLPSTPANYTHRIGRIGRNGRRGVAINLVTTGDLPYMKRITKLINRELPLINWNERISNDTIDTLPLPRTIERKEKGRNVGLDITKLYINGGKRKKLRAADIVGALCSISNITPDDIGIIEIKENETYVEILNNKSQLALNGLQDKNIKGRKYKVHIARMISKKKVNHI